MAKSMHKSIVFIAAVFALYLLSIFFLPDVVIDLAALACDLIAAGLIAGEALIGLLFAGLAFFEINYGDFFPSLIPVLPLPFVVSLVIFAMLGWLLVKYPVANAGNPDDPAPPSGLI